MLSQSDKRFFKISCSQAISCIGYNVNLQTAVATILVFIECPKSIASEVLVVLRSYQNVKSIPQAVFKISRSQTIVDRRTDGRTARRTDGQGHSTIRPVFRRAYKNKDGSDECNSFWKYCIALFFLFY